MADYVKAEVNFAAGRGWFWSAQEQRGVSSGNISIKCRLDVHFRSIPHIPSPPLTPLLQATGLDKAPGPTACRPDCLDLQFRWSDGGWPAVANARGNLPHAILICWRDTGHSLEGLILRAFCRRRVPICKTVFYAMRFQEPSYWPCRARDVICKAVVNILQIGLLCVSSLHCSSWIRKKQSPWVSIPPESPQRSGS